MAENQVLSEEAPAFLGVERSVRDKIWVERLNQEGRNQALAISQMHGISELLGRVIVGRGATSDEVEDWLNPSLKNLMPDPASLADMQKGAERLAEAIKAKQNVAIFGDYDVDGATSSAMVHKFCTAHNLISEIYIPDRIFEGYGPNSNAIEQLIDNGAELIITVDCGTMSDQAFEVARVRNIDVMVVDHHLAPENLPDVRAIINPNRQDDLSGLGYLSAAGVVFMLLVATQRHLREQGFYQTENQSHPMEAPDLLAWLDLVALSTICDVVPLKGLNRAFVRRGLEVMHKRQNIGLRALSDSAGLKEAPNSYHLGFVLGPRINAGGRIGKSSLGAELLSLDDELAAGEIAIQLDRLNHERKALEIEMLEDAVSQVEKLLALNPDTTMIMVGSEDWHKGLVGLVASRITERYRRPSCILSWQEEKNEATGSLRSVSGIDIGKVVQLACDEGLLIKGGGHAMAAGLTVSRENYQALSDFFSKHLQAKQDVLSAPSVLKIDGVLTAKSATSNFFKMLEQAGPYGMANPAPRFVLSSHLVKFAKLVGELHVKCVLQTGDGSRMDAIAFRAKDTPLGDLLLSSRDDLIHVAGRLTRNNWGGRERIELIIEDAARA